MTNVRIAKGSERARSQLIWWLGWIALSIGSFFVSCFFWTRFIAERVGNIREPGVTILWIVAVFGTWLVCLLPLIVLMYNKVDKAYEDARIRREAAQAKAVPKHRAVFVEPSERLLPKELAERLRKVPEVMRRGHLVTAVLKDGRRFENVFVVDRSEVIGIYDCEKVPFEVKDIRDLEPMDLKHLPAFQVEKWLRLDGIGSPPGRDLE